jgi:hypothetical protein
MVEAGVPASKTSLRTCGGRVESPAIQRGLPVAVKHPAPVGKPGEGSPAARHEHVLPRLERVVDDSRLRSRRRPQGADHPLPVRGPARLQRLTPRERQLREVQRDGCRGGALGKGRSSAGSPPLIHLTQRLARQSGSTRPAPRCRRAEAPLILLSCGLDRPGSRRRKRRLRALPGCWPPAPFPTACEASAAS